MPSGNTMLNYGINENLEEINSDKSGYKCYKNKNKINYNFLESDKKDERVLYYKVSDNYNILYNNNTIMIKVKKEDGGEYEASKTFNFSSYGNSGTDYTLIITEEKLNNFESNFYA
jgi:hypothetical protein